ISHLFYADDVVFIGQWCDSNISTIIRVLDCFFQTSGMRINLHKSKIMGIAVDNSLVTQAANSIGCLTLSLPFQYLGVNIGATPIYYMSMYKAPMYVINKLEAIRSHFFNGGDPNIRKMTFIKWENVLASKDKGGMGVLSFFALNRALIFKWIWRFHSQGFSLWSRVIKAIHGVDGMLGYHIKPSASSNWIDIVRTLPILLNKGIDLLGYIKKKVGNGEKTMFWYEPWKGDVSFNNLFPRSGAEASQMAMLTSLLEGICLPNMLDRWCWSVLGDEEFFVSSARILIDDKTFRTVGSKTHWCKYVPLKVNILSWRVKLNNLPTQLNLSRRGGGFEYGGYGCFLLCEKDDFKFSVMCQVQLAGGHSTAVYHSSSGDQNAACESAKSWSTCRHHATGHILQQSLIIIIIIISSSHQIHHFYQQVTSWSSFIPELTQLQASLPHIASELHYRLVHQRPSPTQTVCAAKSGPLPQ
ncbi:RNA-directed DNA polymerase, eukaryota, reverse transcriptase zinc-binding domain protein, partial [Tanacetum coccineum]